MDDRTIIFTLSLDSGLKHPERHDDERCDRDEFLAVARTS
jgi:hypothetical protein